MNNDIHPIAEWRGYDLYFDPSYIEEVNVKHEDKSVHTHRCMKIHVDMDSQYEFPDFFTFLKECSEIDVISDIINLWKITDVECVFVRIPSFINKHNLSLYLTTESEVEYEDKSNWWKYD